MDRDTFYRLTSAQRSAELLRSRTEGLVEHRSVPSNLEAVRTLDGVDYINDSKSTFLDATLQAMADVDQPIVWIAGDLGAGIAQGHVQEFLKDRVVALVLFGKAGERGINALKPFTAHMHVAEELRTAVFLARELARNGEVVLFSPACPSGDGFANYEERGAEFKRAVRDL